MILCLFVMSVCPLYVAAEADLEAELKTAYLVNIARFTTWSNQDEKKILCIFKESTIYPEVSQLLGFEFGPELPLMILVDPTHLGSCHMLYWDENSETDQNNEILTTSHAGLLVVSDLSDAIKRDFAIQFFVRNLKLRFSINQQVVKESDYKISSKLLRLSRQMD